MEAHKKTLSPKFITDSAEFLFSAPSVMDMPPAQGYEVAFFGRSNVGKSSLLNAMCNRNGLAKASKTPGRTQLIQLFDLAVTKHFGDDKTPLKFRFVDLPGYGYAAISGAKKRNISKILSEMASLQGRNLVFCLLFDIRREPSELDFQLIEFLRDHNLPFVVAVTKSDKIVKSRRKNEVGRIFKVLTTKAKIESLNLVATSVHERMGVDALWDMIVGVADESF